MFNKLSLKAALVAAVFGVCSLTANAEVKNSFSLDTEIGYDSNVYQYTTGPLAKRESMVFKIAPKYTADFTVAGDWSTQFIYTPAAEFFAAESSQDNLKQDFALNMKGEVSDFDVSLKNSLRWTNAAGDDDMQRPTGLSPFLGGYIERDRKDALIWKNAYTATKKTEKMLYRVVLDGYYHDFRAKQDVPANPGFGYINHIDRSEFNVGFDVGYKAFEDGYLYAGYRLGRMWQGTRPGGSVDYTNTYHRLLVGKEGTFMDGKLSVDSQIGVDFRDFTSAVAAGFDKTQSTLHLKSSTKYTINDDWSVKASSFRKIAVASTGASVYEQAGVNLMVTNKTTDKLTLSGGLDYMAGDWMAYTGVNRTDHRLTPTLKATYAYSDNLTFDGVYLYEDVDLVDPNSESVRHYVGVGANYKF